MCITQHTGPTALRPIRRMKQLWLSVLLKDTSAATDQPEIRTHILTTPELESSALDRSATTLHICSLWVRAFGVQCCGMDYRWVEHLSADNRLHLIQTSCPILYVHHTCMY